MMIKNSILLVLLFMTKQLSAQQRVIFKPEDTRVSITVKNSQNKNLVIQTTPISLGLRPAKPDQKKVALDDRGSGTINLLLTGPAYIKIMDVWIDSSMDYLLLPGKVFSLELDANDKKFAVYDKKWERENDFYNFMMEDAQRRLDEIPQNDPVVFWEEWNKQNDYSDSLIKIASDQGMDNRYTSWVLQSVRSAFYSTMIRQLINYVTIAGKWPENMEKYLHSLTPLSKNKFDDPLFFNSESDKEWVGPYFLYVAASHFYETDSIHAPGLEQIYEYAFSKAKGIIDPGVRRTMIQYLAESVITSTNDIEFLDRLQNSLKNQSKADYYFSLIESRIALLQIAPKGSPALLFRAEDKDRNAFSFSEYQGKYIYLDVWATWCIPCRNQIPFLNRMKEKYSGKPIVFISVSEDRSVNIWKNFLNDLTDTADQFISDPELKGSISQTYRIKYIPRFILIDPNGKIVSADCFRPSDPALNMLLNKLLY